MSLMREFACTFPECGKTTVGIPFGPVGEEWCEGCHLEMARLDGENAGQFGEAMGVYGMAARHACGHEVHYVLNQSPTDEMRRDAAAELCLECLVKVGERDG